MRRLVLLAVLVACSSSSAPTKTTSSHGPVDQAAIDAALAGCTRDPGATPPSFDPNSKDDPTGGPASFTLDKALAGFPAGPGKLVAVISTEKGVIKCELAQADAPISVANFVGLARGTRPYYGTDDKWKVGRFYDGLLWHRVIPDFVIQGGDPQGDGTGGPGYDMIDENHAAEPAGTLAMAAAKAPSGSQIYVVVGKGPNPNYNVFGTCATDTAIKIATVDRDGMDKPTTDVHLQRVDIARCP